MKHEEMVSRELTDKEWELIQAIRNYKRAFPNGAKKLIIYIQELLADLLERN
ncbi:hypothetical protein [Ornithobacterium rhinotracheale]|uniref:hypothetical protein n=1 Tax=Ornithobacterium rhinotracheale TaxID=28251 RepID=UPI001623ADB7|nr:hypothetical protein [Ornithobacterium rhinotracheale]